VIVGDGRLEGRGTVGFPEEERVGLRDGGSFGAGLHVGLRAGWKGEYGLAPPSTVAADGGVTVGMTAIVAGLREG